jgi:hypothetical protein
MPFLEILFKEHLAILPKAPLCLIPKADTKP